MTDFTLKELLTDLGGIDDPVGLLRAHGYDLPDELIGEAVGQVAAGLPAETAEHLSPFTVADSAIPSLDDSGDAPLDALDGLRLLASAPVLEPDSGVEQPVVEAEAADDGFGSGAGEDAPAPTPDPDAHPTDIDADADTGPALSVDAAVGFDELDPSGLDAPAVDLGAEVELTVDDGFLEADDPADLDGIE